MMLKSPVRRGVLAVLLAFPATQYAQTPPLTPDIPAKYKAPTASYDYVKREAMVPMRDGVKLFTVVVVPKGAKNAPIILTRTPYNAAGRTRADAVATHARDSAAG